MIATQNQAAYMMAQAEIRRQIKEDLSQMKQVIESISCDQSTDCSESNRSDTDITDLSPVEATEEVTISLAVPVFESTTSGGRFENKPSTAEKIKNKILKPIQEEDCEETTVDRQQYKNTFKKVRKDMKAMDIKVGKNPLFLSADKLQRKAKKLIKWTLSTTV